MRHRLTKIEGRDMSWPKPDWSDKEIAEALRATAEKAAQLKSELEERGWDVHVTLHTGRCTAPSATVTIGRRENI